MSSAFDPCDAAQDVDEAILLADGAPPAYWPLEGPCPHHPPG